MHNYILVIVSSVLVVSGSGLVQDSFESVDTESGSVFRQAIHRRFLIKT
jgi:hypothetical protein